MIVAGFGFSSRASTESLVSALAAARGPHAIDAVATLADKAAALEPLAKSLGVPLLTVIGPLPDTLTQSAHSLAARGTGSVAEACALDAAGNGAYLLGPRAISDDRLATCALAKGNRT